MKYKNTKNITLLIMIIGIAVEVISLMFDIRYFDVGALIFLIGLVTNDVITYQHLKKYIKKFGDIDEV